MLAPAREHLRLQLPPEHLCHPVVARSELRGAARPGLGLVESVELVERLRERPGRRRGEALLAQLAVQPHRFRAGLGGRRRIAGQELEVGAGLVEHRKREAAAALLDLRSHVPS